MMATAGFNLIRTVVPPRFFVLIGIARWWSMAATIATEWLKTGDINIAERTSRHSMMGEKL
ncbi:hypothetical protein ACNKU7_02775 [Microbulbifer sp. SA54]|uniref:hypothetical protein n=1 Tax=Microbulbifer sp. SA54 TaxID=3401577 RepID=UPI003AAC0519